MISDFCYYIFYSFLWMAFACLLYFYITSHFCFQILCDWVTLDDMQIWQTYLIVQNFADFSTACSNIQIVWPSKAIFFLRDNWVNSHFLSSVSIKWSTFWLINKLDIFLITWWCAFTLMAKKMFSYVLMVNNLIFWNFGHFLKTWTKKWLLVWNLN